MYRAMSSSAASSPLGTQRYKSILGVGTEVSLKHQSGSTLGLVLKSAPGSLWVVHWYDLGKTSTTKYNQLLVVTGPTRDSLIQVGLLLKALGDKPIDFPSDTELRQYFKSVESNIGELGSRKMPACPSSKKKSPVVVSPPVVHRSTMSSRKPPSRSQSVPVRPNVQSPPSVPKKKVANSESSETRGK